MIDGYGRNIEYLRISVTDRCNLRCRYCMPEQGIVPKTHDEILSFEEFLHVVMNAVELGIDKIRVTGGEPLVRKGIVSFIKALSHVPGIKDISMTTNGCLLPRMAKPLAKAGLARVNISLDSLKADKFHYITRTGNLNDVLTGIDAALEAGLTPVKINCVVNKGFNDDEIPDFADLTINKPLHVRFIELMPLGSSSAQGFVPNELVKKKIGKKLVPLDKDVKGSGPARYYNIEGAMGSIGFISPLSQHFCHECNRVRLTADGKLKPCLESDSEIDIRSIIRTGGSNADLQDAIKRAVAQKPKNHHMIAGAYHDHTRTMSQIGG
jgi:cyclic pyranopterin phosphate synthase